MNLFKQLQNTPVPPPEVTKGLKTCTFDLETTGLRMDYGKIVCCVVQDVVTLKQTTLRLAQGERDDKKLVRDIVKLLNSYDVLVGWYSSRADIRWINTRVEKHKLPHLQKNYRRDLWETCRRNFSLRNNRLETAHDFFFGKSNKTKITPDVWDALMHGDKWAMDYVVKHCQIDVKETTELYWLFSPYYSPKLRK